MKPEEKSDCADITRCGSEVKMSNDCDSKVMNPVIEMEPTNDEETVALKENIETEGRLNIVKSKH